MPRRSRAREIVLQVLYQQDLNPDYDRRAIAKFVTNRLHARRELVDFANSLIQGVVDHRDEMDQLLEEKAENWSLSRMAATDRNVLRLGAYEILHSDTPPRVVINEAVELARRFGSAQSSLFVNGILDRLMHDCGAIE